MMRGAEKRLLGGDWGERGEWGVWREKGGNRERGGGEKNIRVNFCWRILIFRCASKTPAPAKFCWRNARKYLHPGMRWGMDE
jgi:hypothetical protein